MDKLPVTFMCAFLLGTAELKLLNDEPYRFGEISQSDIEQAIKWGAEGEPEPYPLVLHNTITGAVYTPFVRIALASYNERRSGRQLTPDKLPAWLTEPLIYFAIKWVPSRDEPPPQDAQMVLVKSGMLPVNDSAVHALRVSNDVATLTRFGVKPPFPGGMIIGVFPSSAVAAGHDVLAFDRWHSQGRGGRYRGGRLTDEDLRKWR